MSTEIDIKTGFNELPRDTQSALSEIHSLLGLSLCEIRNPRLFNRKSFSESIMQAYKITSKILVGNQDD